MNKITTNLAGKSNAVLVDDNSDLVAVISCPAKADITKKIKQAIKDHCVATNVEITKRFPKTELNNQEQLSFEVDTIEDGEDCCRLFSLYVVASY